MVLFLREADVEKLLTMDAALEAVENAFRQHGQGRAVNSPRSRVRVPKGVLNMMGGALLDVGLMGLKVYTWFRPEARFIEGIWNAGFLLYSSETGELLAVIEPDKLSQMRTGAATGVATKYMARADARKVGIFGTGRQARSQLTAVCAVRAIEKAVAYSRHPENRVAFSREMSRELGIEVTPAGQIEDVVAGADIIITATTAREPLFDGRWLAEGVHINAVGGNSLVRRELDEETIGRSSVVVVDSKDQAKLECGEFLVAVEKGKLRWEAVHELADVVSGQVTGRNHAPEITLFKSLGIAIEDVAVAAKVYGRAKREKLGQSLSIS